MKPFQDFLAFIFSRRKEGQQPTKGGLTENAKEIIPLIGKKGHAKTKLSLAGWIEIDGRTFEAISKNQLIQKGEPVSVIGKCFGLLLVKPIRSK